MNMLMLAADLPTFLPAGEMDWRGWVTIGVFCVTFFALVKEIRPPDIVMFISSSVLVVLGILTPSEFLDGFSQDILLTIAMLCIVVRAMEVNGLLEILTRRLLTDSSSYFKQMGSLLFPVGVSSAFLNNTPIVLMMAPVVRRWALKLKVSPSKFLLPMSYIAVLGGVCTIMGTSTNLIIEGLVRKQSPESVIGFFEIAWVGLPIFVVGSIYLFMIGRLIPARLDPISAIEEETREFTSEFIIEEGCPLAKARIREISGRYFRKDRLVEVERKGTIIDSPDPDFLLLEGDRLVFIGDIHEIAELHSIKGLKSCQDPKFAFDPASSHFAEVVISTTSLLIGKTVRQTNFRTTYGPSVLAVYRQGRRVEGNVSDTVLMAGDTLMLLSGEAWPANNITSKDFYVIRNVEKLQVFDPFRAFVIIGSLIGVVLLAVAGVPLAYASLMAVLVLIFTKSVTLRDAQKGIVWNILLLIACSVAFSKALVSTHAAHYLTQQVYPLIGDSPYQLIAGILLITILCTELLTNNAAAIILFPFAMELAKIGGYTSPEAIKTIAITIAVGASCCFAVPTGYQTHMIVYGFGGYRFTDFLRAGLPLDFIIFLMVPHIILHFWPLS